jgi:hypothetical protein
MKIVEALRQKIVEALWHKIVEALNRYNVTSEEAERGSVPL